MLLDLGLPGEDGFAIARQLREHWRCGLVIVTGRGDAVDKVVGLEVGADDYVTKPFDLRELLARDQGGAAPGRAGRAAHAAAPAAAARRPAVASPAGSSTSAARRLLDPERRRGRADQRRVRPAQHASSQHAGRVLSRDFLLEQTRGREAAPFDRTIDVQVGRLRKKLEADAENPQIIKSVRGAGYILVAPVTTG